MNADEKLLWERAIEEVKRKAKIDLAQRIEATVKAELPNGPSTRIFLGIVRDELAR